MIKRTRGILLSYPIPAKIQLDVYPTASHPFTKSQPCAQALFWVFGSQATEMCWLLCWEYPKGIPRPCTSTLVLMKDKSNDGWGITSFVGLKPSTIQHKYPIHTTFFLDLGVSIHLPTAGATNKAPRAAFVVGRPPGHHNGCDERLEVWIWGWSVQKDNIYSGIQFYRFSHVNQTYCSQETVGFVTLVGFSLQVVQRNAWHFAAHGGCIFNELLGELFVVGQLKPTEWFWDSLGWPSQGQLLQWGTCWPKSQLARPGQKWVVRKYQSIDKYHPSSTFFWDAKTTLLWSCFV